MTGAISGIEGIARQASSQMTNASNPALEGAMDVNVRSSGTSAVSGENFASELGSRVYDTIDQVGVTLQSPQTSGAEALEKARKAITPESAALRAPGTETAQTGNDSLKALSKTFDHAVFMAMCNQVISGVSDSARTLIRQT